MARTHFKTAFGCDLLQSPWGCVVGKKGSRRTSVRLRALFTSSLAHTLFARSRFKTSFEMGSRTRRNTEIILGVSLLVIITNLVGLHGCSKKKDESRPASNSGSALDSQTQGEGVAQSNVEAPAGKGRLELGDAGPRDQAVVANEICRRGDRYVAIRDVFQHPCGWIAFKIETNLDAPFDLAQCPEAYAYCRDRGTLLKWGFTENQWLQLNRLMWQGMTTDDQDTAYLQEPGNRRALIHFDTRDDIKTQWRICYPDDGFLRKRYVTRLTFRTLSNVRNRMPDQSPDDYMDWKNDSGQFQMFSVAFPVPQASEECPYTIAVEMKALIEKVERQMLLRRIPLLEDPAAIEEAFAQFRSWPRQECMRENLAWLSCLAKHGRAAEAQAYLQEYRAYVEEVDKDGTKQVKTVLLPQAERHFQRLFGEE
jgi:hypothetical protein